MTDENIPFHAHVYFEGEERSRAEALRDRFVARAGPGGPVLFVGRMTDGPAGPHPIPQFEVHFLKRSLDEMLTTIRASGLRALVHPLTDDDLADHTSLGEWIGAPIELDVSVLDPVGQNQGIPRFGKTDF